MMRDARNHAESDQKGTRKATRARKADVNLFTALEPSLGASPIFHMLSHATPGRHLARMSWRIVVACICRFTFMISLELGYPDTT
eukprot:3993172-Pleurochrysis_carterae.AAC.1